MLIFASLVAGVFTDWWWLPASCGLVGQIAHYLGSEAYRRTLREVPRALTAAGLSMMVLTALCLAAFFIGRLLAMALPS